MLPPTPNPEPPSQPLPLFRAEALAARQHKFYGEILLIRPLSLTLLVWLGIGISAAVLGFLLLGTYTEKAYVDGFLLPRETDSRQADLFIPAQMVKFVRLGQSIQIGCRSCSQIEAQTRTATVKTGTVKEISKLALSPDELPAQLNTSRHTSVQGPIYRARLLLPKEEAEPFPEGARLEATLPLGRKPLLNWLFERGASSTWENGNQ
jgi:hypothetical protein